MSFVSFSAGAADYKSFLNNACSDLNSQNNKNPVEISDCTFGMCAICDNKDHFNPRAEVLYMPGAYIGFALFGKLPVYKRSIGLYQCAWLLGVRFCVRPTQSGDIDSPIDLHHSTPWALNTSGRPRICAYEDPCDGMDPPDGNCAVHSNLSPYPYRAPATSVISWEQAGALSAITFVFCPVCAVVPLLVAGITSTYNQTVITPIGCIDRTIGPMPPTWKNSAWWNNASPPPTFSDAGVVTYIGKVTASSVFEAPVIDMRVCKDTNTATIIDCSLNNAVTDTDTNTSAKLNLSSTATAGCSGDNTTTAPYCNCKTVSYTLLNANVTYCAQIKTDKPDMVTISARYGSSPNYSYDYLLSIPRPGYIPKPTVAKVDGTLGTSNIGTAMSVTLRGATITLSEPLYTYTASGVTYTCNPKARIIDSGVTRNGYCVSNNIISALPANLTTSPPSDWALLPQTYPVSSTIHQVPFSIGRPCVDLELSFQAVTDVNGNSYGAYVCNQYQDMVCIEGYDTAPFVAVNTATPEPYATLGDTPNVKNNNHATTITIGTAFPNVHSNQENGAYLSEAYTASTDDAHSFDGNVWVYPYTATSGTPAAPATSEYDYNNNAHSDTLRILNSKEAGMCVKTAPDQRVFIYNSPGSYSFTVPINCSRMQVSLWGGGAAGAFGNSDHDESGRSYSGGAGGYVSGAINSLASGTSISIQVGDGGNTNSGWGPTRENTPGDDSYIKVGSTTYATARGGDNAGNGGGASAPGLSSPTIQNGSNGVFSGHCASTGSCCSGSLQTGGSSYNYPQATTSSCANGQNNAYVGGGGCSQGNEMCYDCVDGYILGRCQGSESRSHGDGYWGKGGDGQVIIQCIR